MKVTPLLTSIFAIFLQTSSVFAADIFVAPATGADLSEQQSESLTGMVMRAVRRRPEHALVSSMNQADFGLRPTILDRNNQLFLRIEKVVGGEIVAMSEESIDSIETASVPTTVATDTALLEDRLSAKEDPMIAAAPAGAGEETNSLSGSSTAVGDLATDSSPTNDVRAPSPAMRREDRRGTFQLGLGPAIGLGLNTDTLLYDVNFAYSRTINEIFSARAFGDLNLSTGTDAARFMSFAMGGEYYPAIPAALPAKARPYLDADLGYAFTRDSRSRVADAPALGAGAGFRFAANELNLDVNLHYTLLTAEIDGRTPSVVALRGALNF